jgi:uncharacterized delta-60 repeat protein
VQILAVLAWLFRMNFGWILICLSVAGTALAQDLSFIEIGSFLQTGTEDIGFVNVPIIRSGNLERTSTVEYYTEDETATAGLDYDSTSGVLTFAPGETNQFVRVHYIFDAENEPGGSEILWLVLGNADAGSKIQIPGDRVSLYIDDTSPEARPVGGEVKENAGQFLVPIRRGGKPEILPEITLSYTTREGTAVPGLDFISTSGTITMGAGVAEVTVPVTIVNDSRRESIELFTFETTDTAGATKSTEIAIIDDDPGFSFGIKSPLSVAESAGEITIPILRGGNGTDTISVDYMTVSASAIEGEDYDKAIGTLTFAPDEGEKSITIKLRNDILVEESEAFDLRLINPSYGTRLGMNTNLTVILQDDDQGVSFEQNVYITEEDRKQVHLKVLKKSDPPAPATINYEISGITAKEGEDYLGSSGTLTMGADEDSGEIVINLKDDAILEDPEVFQVTLTSESGVGLGAESVATVIIKDAEPVSGIDFEYTRGMQASVVDRLLVQKDGKILVASWFFGVHGIWCQELCRLKPDGSLDARFAQGRGVLLSRTVNHSSPWGTLSLDSKERIIIAGRFGRAEGKEIHGLVRLNQDGSVDESFSPVFDGIAVMAAPLADSSVVFLANGRLLRALADGTIDSNYATPSLSWSFRTSFVADAAGRVLCANVRLSDADLTHWPLLRFLPNGSVDPSFSPPEGSAYINSILIQPDGKILAGTALGACAGVPNAQVCNTLFRLNPDGALDQSFVLPQQTSDVLSLVLQGNGQILAGYRVQNPYIEKAVKRFKSNGEVDPGFGPFGWNGYVMALAPLQDGSVLAGGWFQSIEGSLTNIAHLVGRPVAGIAGIRISPEQGVEIPVAASPGHDYVLEETNDFLSWLAVATKHAQDGGIFFNIPSTAFPVKKFYRIRVVE